MNSPPRIGSNGYVATIDAMDGRELRLLEMNRTVGALDNVASSTWGVAPGWFGTGLWPSCY